MSIQKPRLFTTDTLVVQETRSVMRSEYSIFDDNGTQIAQITQAGSLSHRMLNIGIKYNIFDMNEDGGEDDKLLTITDPSNVFGDTYKMLTPDGAQITTAKTKRFSLKSCLTLPVKRLSDVDIDGDLRGKNYTLTSKGRSIAKIDREYHGLKGAITGEGAYALHLRPNLSEETRTAVIDTTLVTDIVRHRSDKTAAVSVS